MSTVKAALPADFTIDVHTHPIPDFYRQALIDAGATIKDGNLIIDGFVTPPWTIESYMEGREKYHYDYSILSMTAPGVNFLCGNPSAVKLARRCNEAMAGWCKQHPTKLGASACLPLPNIEASLQEISYCLDVLKMDSVGLYTNYNGVYLGDPSLDPIMEELHRRKVTVTVHPVEPQPTPNMLKIPTPALEYPFDTTRAIVNLILHGTVAKFPDTKLIFSHGGGTVPFLADRISGILQIPTAYGSKNPVQTMAQMRSFYFDLAGATSGPSLLALKDFVGAGHLLVGSDVPYFPDRGLPSLQKNLYEGGHFTPDEMRGIRHGTALELFPGVAEKLKGLGS